MSNITTFFTSFCVSAILIGAFYIICPGGEISKSVKNIFALVFTLVIISSALTVNPVFDFSGEISQNEEITNSIDTSGAVYVYSECLKAAKIEFSKISVLTNKNEDGGIVISKVLIFSSEEKEKILSALSVIAQNLEVEVINE